MAPCGAHLLAVQPHAYGEVLTSMFPTFCLLSVLPASSFPHPTSQACTLCKFWPQAVFLRLRHHPKKARWDSRPDLYQVSEEVYQGVSALSRAPKMYSAGTKALHSQDMVEATFLLKYFNPHPRICLLILEKEEGEREREKHQCEKATLIGCLSYTPDSGIKPAT